MTAANVLEARLGRLLDAARRLPLVPLPEAPPTSPPLPEAAAAEGWSFTLQGDVSAFPAVDPLVALRAAVPDVATVGEAAAEVEAGRAELLQAALKGLVVGSALGRALAWSWGPEDEARLAEAWPWPDDTRAGALATLIGRVLPEAERDPYPLGDLPMSLAGQDPILVMLLALHRQGMAWALGPDGLIEATTPGPLPAVGGAERPVVAMGLTPHSGSILAHVPSGPVRLAPGSLACARLAIMPAHLAHPWGAWRVAAALAGLGDRDDRHGARLAAIRWALGLDDDDQRLAALALVDEARLGGWAGELVSVARELAAMVPAPPESPDDRAAFTAARAADGALVTWLRARGPEAKALADELEGKAAIRHGEGRDPWSLWTTRLDPWWVEVDFGPPDALRLAARALWLAKWRPALEDQEQARRRVGLAVLLPRTFDPVVATTRAQRVGPVVDGVLTLEGARGSSLSELVINSHTAALPEYSPREIRALVSSMTSHRWIRFILPELQGLWFLAGREVPVIIEGGKAGIVERLRAAGLGGSRRDEPVLPGVIAAWGAVRAMTDRTVGNLYSYEMPRTEADWKTRTGRAGAVVKVSPGPVLDPHVMMAERRKLTIPLIRDLPPLHWVDPTSHSPVVTLSMLVVRDMWVQREEMLDEGGILGGAEWWSERTSEGGLTNPGPLAWERVRDGLRSEDGRTEPGRAGGAPTPPFIRVVNPAEPEARWRYTLANDAARRWIENAGEASKKGAERFAKGDKRKKGRLKP